MSLVPFDPKNEGSVLTLLEVAAVWLAEAVHRGEPGDIAMVKAQMATAAEATKQLNLSKDIQLDAQEMVRRAEYALGKAIRRGQADGTIARGRGGDHGNQWTGGKTVDIGSAKPIAEDFEPNFYANGSQIVHMVDGADPADFEEVLDEAKAEGNLSRANVVRKIKAKGCERPMTRDAKADLIESMAGRGFTSRQMAGDVGVTDARVREIARAYDIDIPADRVVGKQRRLDHTQMVASTVNDLVITTEFIEAHIDLTQVDFAEADEWVSSLSDSIAALTRFRKQIKEKTHV